MTLLEDIAKLEKEITDLNWQIEDLEDERHERQLKLDKLEKALQDDPDSLSQVALEAQEKAEERKQLHLIKSRYGAITKQIADYWTR